MPRTPRIDFAGARHHVMNRAASRRHAFADDAELELFLRVVAELPGRFDLRVHGWALMSTHYHLMIEVPRGNLTAAMHYLGVELAAAVNRLKGWDGPLFRSRFRNRVVLDEPYWRHLLAYVHLNPVAAGLVRHPDQSARTSHRAYAGLDAAPPWLHRDELLSAYGSADTYRAAIDDLVAARHSLPPEFDEDRLWAKVNTAPERLDYPLAAVSSLEPAAALAQVAEQLGVAVDDLMQPASGRPGNLARRLAAWWLLRSTALSRAQVGARLGMSAGAVGSASWRIRKATEPTIAQARDTLERRWLEPLRSGAGD